MTKLNSFSEVRPSGGRAVFTAYNKKIADDIAKKLAAPRRGDLRFSPQQEAIFAWVKDPNSCLGGGIHVYGEGTEGCLACGLREQTNAVVEAVAGAGKTTTLVEVCRLFNMEVSSATFHSIGLRAWQSVAGRPLVKAEKIEDLMEEEGVPKHLRAFVGKLVSLGKQRGIGIRGLDDNLAWLDIIEHFSLEELLPDTEPLESATPWATRILNRSIDSAREVIDFEDMIYMPLQANAPIPQYDWVLVDELQDTNPTRRELARRMLSPTGRFIGIGDPHQAIYGFTGADNDAMQLVEEQFQCVTLPLSVTYRCAKAVVRHAQQWVSHIQAHEDAPEGSVKSITLKEFQELHIVTPQTSLRNFEQGKISMSFRSIGVEDAILCRNTRPLIEIAFDMIRRRIACHVEGRDIGQGLITLVKKWKSVRTIYQLRNKLEEYREAETMKFRRRGRKDKIASLEDKVGTLMVFMQSLRDDDSIYVLIESINSLFKDTETGKKAATVTLSTVHKAKGREWPRVYLLGRNVFMPSKYAKLEWQREQEKNLVYVAVTRAMQELIEVDYPLPGTEGPEGWPDEIPTEVIADLDDVATPRHVHLDTAPRRYLAATELQQKVDSGELKSLPPHPLDEAMGEARSKEAARRLEEFLARHDEMRRNGMTNLSEEG